MEVAAVERVDIELDACGGAKLDEGNCCCNCTTDFGALVRLANDTAEFWTVTVNELSPLRAPPLEDGGSVESSDDSAVLRASRS